jgi:hypothetical protein
VRALESAADTARSRYSSSRPSQLSASSAGSSTTAASALSLRTCLSTCYMTTPAAFSRAFWNWRWLVSPVPFLSLVKSWRAIKDGERSMGLALNLGATTAVTLIGKQSRRSEFMHGTGWANSSTRRSAFLSGLKESIFWMPISPCTISVNGMFHNTRLKSLHSIIDNILN